ncbi:hypothetical protein FOZ63_025369 [Perkinsus olseni]|uniref:Alternative oxidase, mitochondrial n=1 Tax=Perkinsus olseni TaxID=32597 RepID=A0A7J6RYP5_PEROL|nr:hypothetical protein FOZ63_025369 [Perkinsus olseni]
MLSTRVYTHAAPSALSRGAPSMARMMKPYLSGVGPWAMTVVRFQSTVSGSANATAPKAQFSSAASHLKAHEMGSNSAGTVHFKRHPPPPPEAPPPPSDTAHSNHSLPHPIWNLTEIEQVEQTHYPPRGFSDRAAYYTVQALRHTFDTLSGYKFGKHDAKLWVRRMVFLETVAAVPGMVGGMVRHLNSLRNMERDHGWIHTLLEEAENERMHLMIALTLKEPGPLLRGLVLVSQGIFFWSYGLLYLLAPKFNHRFVGYLEEEAVKTYTNLLKCIDEGKVPEFTSEPAPFIARDYYELSDDATLRDVFACIRADESHHRDVNHTFASADENGSKYRNPFPPGH